MCGELSFRSGAADQLSGSSPRVRGTGPDAHKRPAPERFIPACAGNWCFGVQLDPKLRFIPACAGNCLEVFAQSRRNKVHPRVCGELADHRARADHRAGSSPRVRGTVVELWRGLSRAGSSRVCGELSPIALKLSRTHGSSPRVRGTADLPPGKLAAFRFIPACAGTVWTCAYGRADSRFIPACAGNCRRGIRNLRGEPVHPRVCGELRAGNLCGSRPPGSSPRVRGTDRCGPARSIRPRFIPACAGN